MKTLKNHTSAIVCLKILANDYLASGAEDCIDIWDLKIFQRLFSLFNQEDVSCIEQLFDGHTLLCTSSWHGQIRVWDLFKQTCVNLFEAHKNRVVCLKALRLKEEDEEKDFFASGAFDGSIKIWNGLTCECVDRLFFHSKAVSCLEFKKQDSQLISCSWDRSIAVWNLKEKNRLFRVLEEAHAHFISGIKLTSCGHLLSCSWDKNVKLWDLDSSECMQTIQNRSPIHRFDSLI